MSRAWNIPIRIDIAAVAFSSLTPDEVEDILVAMASLEEEEEAVAFPLLEPSLLLRLPGTSVPIP